MSDEHGIAEARRRDGIVHRCRHRSQLVRGESGAVAVAGQVECQRDVTGRQGVHDGVPHGVVEREAVQEDERPRPRTGISLNAAGETCEAPGFGDAGSGVCSGGHGRSVEPQGRLRIVGNPRSCLGRPSEDGGERAARRNAELAIRGGEMGLDRARRDEQGRAMSGIGQAACGELRDAVLARRERLDSTPHRRARTGSGRSQLDACLLGERTGPAAMCELETLQVAVLARLSAACSAAAWRPCPPGRERARAERKRAGDRRPPVPTRAGRRHPIARAYPRLATPMSRGAPNSTAAATSASPSAPAASRLPSSRRAETASDRQGSAAPLRHAVPSAPG